MCTFTPQQKVDMLQQLVKLVPAGFICPLCGEMEPKTVDYPLKEYNSWRNPFEFRCQHHNKSVKIVIDDDMVRCETSGVCYHIDGVDKSEYLSSTSIHRDRPVIEWTIPFAVDGIAGKDACTFCENYDFCAFAKEDDSNRKYLTFGFLFDEEEYFGIVPKEEKKMTPTTANPFMKFMTTTPLQKLEPVKDWCTKHKTTLQWVVPVGAVAIAAKMLKENKELVDKGKAMGLPFLDKKAKITRLATLGGTYAIAYGLSKTLLNSDKEGLKEATGKVEELATKHPRFATRAEEVLPTAISVLIAYAMTEKPQWAERTFESSSAFYDNLKVGFVLAKDYVFDKAGIDDEQAKKICICLGVSFALVALYKGAQKKEELSEMAEKFVDFSIKVTKTLAPPVFASIASVLVYMNLWPDEVIDAITEIDEEDEDADTDTADEDCTD